MEKQISDQQFKEFKEKELELVKCERDLLMRENELLERKTAPRV